MQKAQAFEHKFKEDYLKAFPNALCFKIPNQMSGYININNYADFMCFDSERLYFIDCKTHKGKSFPFDAFPQFIRLFSLKEIPKLVTGIVLWLYEIDIVCFIPTYTIAKMKKDGFKSINPTKIDTSKYYIKMIPSTKKITFMDSNYKDLVSVPDYLTYTKNESDYLVS